MGSKKLLKVGSADDSDIVVAQQTVSRLHCSLEWTGSAWTIRDLGSTNGTFVNGDRIDTPHLLKPSDQVTLGRGIPLPVPSKPIEDKVASSPRTNVSQTMAADSIQLSSGSKAQNPLLIAASAVALLLAGVLFFNMTSKKAPVAPPNDTIASNTTLPPSDPTASSSALVAPKTTDPQPSPSLSGSLSKSNSPYYAVVIETEDGKDRRLLGTAVAIDSHRILTLATFVEAAKTLASKGPVVLRLYQPNAGSSGMNAPRTLVHPKFAAAISARKNFETEFQERLSQMQENEEPTMDESLKWSGRLEKVTIDYMQSDLACLSFKEELSKYLPIPSVRKNSDTFAMECVLIGFPAIIPNPDVTTGVEKFFIEGSAKIKQNRSSSDPFITVETSDMSGLPLDSLVCIDSQKNMIGICVREEKSESLGSKQRCQVVAPEVFW